MLYVIVFIFQIDIKYMIFICKFKQTNVNHKYTCLCKLPNILFMFFMYVMYTRIILVKYTLKRQHNKHDNFEIYICFF